MCPATPALAATAARSPRCQDEPRVHHRAIFCTALSGEAVPYNGRPDSVRRGGACRHRTASCPLLKPVAARCEPIPAFPLLPGMSACPAWPSAAPVSARCEPISAFPLLPGPSTCPAWPSAASVAAGCEPVPVFLLLPVPPTHPAWLSPASTSAGCESISPNRLTPAPCD